MSRTYRRKHDRRGYLGSKREHMKVCVPNEGTWGWSWIHPEPGTPEYQKASARYHSDAGTYNFKEPGPGWFRNLFATRPNRREVKNELRKVTLDSDYDPVITENNRKILPYWT